MARPKRTKGQRERDLVLISDLYLRGETQETIARSVSEQYGAGFTLSRQQISYDLAILHRRWIDAQMLNMDEVKARELARIDKIEREAWAAWERSQRDAEMVTAKSRQNALGLTSESTRRIEGQTGDPSFLRVVQWCVEQRCKILGLCTDKLDVTSGGDVLIRRVFVEVAPEDETDNDLDPGTGTGGPGG